MLASKVCIQHGWKQTKYKKVSLQSSSRIFRNSCQSMNTNEDDKHQILLVFHLNSRSVMIYYIYYIYIIYTYYIYILCRHLGKTCLWSTRRCPCLKLNGWISWWALAHRQLWIYSYLFLSCCEKVIWEEMALVLCFIHFHTWLVGYSCIL